MSPEASSRLSSIPGLRASRPLPRRTPAFTPRPHIQRTIPRVDGLTFSRYADSEAESVCPWVEIETDGGLAACWDVAIYLMFSLPPRRRFVKE